MILKLQPYKLSSYIVFVVKLVLILPDGIDSNKLKDLEANPFISNKNKNWNGNICNSL